MDDRWNCTSIPDDMQNWQLKASTVCLQTHGLSLALAMWLCKFKYLICFYLKIQFTGISTVIPPGKAHPALIAHITPHIDQTFVRERVSFCTKRYRRWFAIHQSFDISQISFWLIHGINCWNDLFFQIVCHLTLWQEDNGLVHWVWLHWVMVASSKGLFVISDIQNLYAV